MRMLLPVTVSVDMLDSTVNDMLNAPVVFMEHVLQILFVPVTLDGLALIVLIKHLSFAILLLLIAVITELVMPRVVNVMMDGVVMCAVIPRLSPSPRIPMVPSY